MARGGDRRSLRLADADEGLIEAACGANPRTVVAVMSGSAVVMPWIDAPAATLLLWYPGMEGGHTLASVVSGTVAPSGRLPFAIPVRETDLVHFDPDATTEIYDLFHGQWHLDRTGRAAAFPFGFGLATTGFVLEDPRAAANGQRRQRARAQHGRSCGHRGRPGLRRLRDLGVRTPGVAPRRVHARAALEPGAGARVAVPVDLAMLDVRVDGRMHREPGTVRLRVAFDAADPGVTTEVSV